MKADRNVNSGVYPLATPALGGAPPRAETPPARRAPDPEVLLDSLIRAEGGPD